MVVLKRIRLPAAQSCSPFDRFYTRPTFAPKPVLDIKHIRQAPGLYEQNCNSRNYPHLARNSWEILTLHNQWIALQQSARSVREQSNAVRRQLANAASSPDSAARSTLLEEARRHKVVLDEIAAQETALETKIEELALPLPNLSSDSTPDGTVPKVIDYINQHPDKDVQAPRSTKSHVDIGIELGLLDFAAAGQTSGWGWYFLLNEAVMLENALVQYALSVARSKGWKMASPPSMVYSHVADACGFQPRDANGETQIYALAQDEGKPALSMAGTAEIPFAAMKIGTTLEEAALPLKIVGASRCYRAEAGARGVDTKGLYRVHEFTKVELFAWTAPDQRGEDDGGFFDTEEDLHEAPGTAQEKTFDEILSIQREIISGLGLHARVLEMPSTDLGASAQRKVDIEVFFPSRRERDDGFGEVTSLSMCNDYQTRRLATRMRPTKGGSGKLKWPCTVNGTAMAVPRVIAAILENGWDERSRAVKLPEVLRPWMDGNMEIRKGL